MHHSFDIHEAASFGLHEALILERLRYWIRQRQIHNTSYHEGRTWTYCAASALAQDYPYLSAKQVRSALDSLVEQGVLLKAKLSASNWNQTNWYALKSETPSADRKTCEEPRIEQENSICPDGQMEAPKQETRRDNPGNSDQPKRATHNSSFSISKKVSDVPRSGESGFALKTEDQGKPEKRKASTLTHEQSEHLERFKREFSECYAAHFGDAYNFNGGRDGKAAVELIKKAGPEELIELATTAWSKLDPRKESFLRQKAFTLHGLNDFWNEIRRAVNFKRAELLEGGAPKHPSGIPVDW